MSIYFIFKYLFRASATFLFGAVVLPFLLLHGVELTGVTLWFYCTCFVSGYALCLYLTYRLAFHESMVDRLMRQECIEDRFEMFHLFLPPFLCIGLFSCIAYVLLQTDLHVVYPDGGIQNTSAASATIGLGLQVSLSAILFDFLESYNITLTGMRYQGFWFSSFVFAHKTFIGFCFWRAIYLMWRQYAGRHPKKVRL